MYKRQIIDLGLEDEDGRFLGWSGSARESVTVGEHDATPGYLMGPVRPGKWRILIGAYHVEEEGVIVTYELRFHRRQAQWLFGEDVYKRQALNGEQLQPVLV